MRKAFNFYASYFEVYNELNDKDKIQFIDAILKKQFWGIEPTNLTGMAKFAYISQKHSIDSQITGYESKTKQPLLPPTEPPCQAPTEPPCQQEKGKGKEKGKLGIPTLEEFGKFALGKEPTLNKIHVKAKYEAWIENGWKNGNGKEILNWKSTLINTIPYMQKENKVETQTTPKLNYLTIDEKNDLGLSHYTQHIWINKAKREYKALMRDEDKQRKGLDVNKIYDYYGTEIRL